MSKNIVEDPNAFSQFQQAQSAMTSALSRLMVVVERYPDLKANQNFLQLQKDITEVEDTIQYARRYYNGAVKVLNVRVESIPDNLVAKLFGFHTADYFDMEE